MPVISRFMGIVIQMFYSDHAPPHFHAAYAEHEALIGINDYALIKGHLPPKIIGLVVEWASMHQQELINDWELAAANHAPKPIEPL